MEAGTVLTECKHSQGQDPRQQTECIKCGRPLPGWFFRNLEVEREITFRAAGDNNIAESIIQYSESRMMQGPWRDLLTRDFRTDLLEELADARNYLCGWADQRVAHGFEDALSSQQLQALHHLCLAWGLLLRDVEED